MLSRKSARKVGLVSKRAWPCEITYREKSPLDWKADEWVCLNVEGCEKDEGTCWGVVTYGGVTWVMGPCGDHPVTAETVAPCGEREAPGTWGTHDHQGEKEVGDLGQAVSVLDQGDLLVG